MLFASAAGTLITILLVTGSNRCNAQACAADTAHEVNGNWYCSRVKAITYSNFPGNGSYNKVTDMDATSGECATTKYDYRGSLSPLSEELSIHVRGPILLNQIAVYTPAVSPNRKRDQKHGLDGAGHQGNRYHHNHHGIKGNQHHAPAKRSVGQIVSATIDGQVDAWTNTYQGPLPTTSNAETQPALPSTNHPEFLTASIELSSTAVGPTITASNRTWSRQAYYNANAGTAEGITFLNHFGGTNKIPGTAAGGPALGASLSFASSDGGRSGAVSPQVLSNAMIEDNIEVVVMSNRSCDDGGCGYTRPGGVSYHGFGGSQKVFLFGFSMPFSNKIGFNEDMPAIWLLNAQIPLTSQYGTNSDCSCWTSGCGEFDLFEVLDSGNFRCKSTLHMAPAGGSSDWFRRPSEDLITAAVIIGGADEVAAIRVLDQGQSFAESLIGSVIDEWLDAEGSEFDMNS